MLDPAHWKLVLIDDEADIREVMSIALEDSGYRVATAPDGATGLKLCREISPQIVITDVRMPGMSGIQVLEAIKKTHPDIEVIVVTAFGEMELAIKALQLDASDFVTKPINDEALHLALKRARDRYTSRKQLKDYTAFLEREKAKTTQELLRTFDFQKNLIDSSMDGIVGSDEVGTVIIFNRSMEQMLGYSKTQVVNRMKLDELFPPRQEIDFKEALAKEKLGGRNRLFLYETFLVNRDRGRVPVQVSAVVLTENQKKTGLVCFFRDLRDIHQMEREFADQARLLHQDKMMSLGRLAASMVHEINNPLTGILNYIRLMIRILGRGSLAEEQKRKFQQYLDLVENEINRVSQIVASLLAFSRKSPPSFGRVDIDDLLNRCVVLSKHKLELSNIRLNSEIDHEIPAVQGDPNQIQQCLINLIFNAIDAMPGGGALTLRAYFDSGQDRVVIEVEDTGAGIRPEDLPHIFEPFFSTKKEGYGVGLGLSIVYGIMQDHNGSVSAENRIDGGARFRLRLPV